MKDLLILTRRNIHGSEMAEIVERINRDSPVWNLLGYISLDRMKGEMINGYPVLGSTDVMDQYPDAFYAMDFEWRGRMDIPRDRTATLIDPSSFVSRSAQIGQGTIIYPNCYVGLNARIGDGVFILSGSIINHDCVLEDGACLTSAVSLAGSVYVEAGAYLGQACSCRGGVRIGRNSTIGMGCIVLNDVPEGIVMVGNPARELKPKPDRGKQ